MARQSAHPSARWRVALLTCGVLLAAGGAGMRPFTAAATLLVLIAAAAVSVRAIRPPRARSPGTPRVRRGIALWTALLLAIAAWEAYAYVRQPDLLHPSADHPTLSTLLDPALEQGPLRFAGWLVWLGVGWWLVSR
ncbi:hypothetical protein [Nocardia brasiliensis]|uniref:hypothetical protein n=1 Tax=Nocardia brasiliensis TaxID=37326 RepID=UPI003672C9F7